MSDLDLATVAFNVIVFLGYVFTAGWIAPKFKVQTMVTKLGGVLFFLTCGLHHLENAYHVAFRPLESNAVMMTSWHMEIIDFLQAIAIWMFVLGLYFEFIRNDKFKWPPHVEPKL